MLKLISGVFLIASSLAIRVDHQAYTVVKDGKVPDDKKAWDDAFRAKIPAFKDNKKLVVKEEDKDIKEGYGLRYANGDDSWWV